MFSNKQALLLDMNNTFMFGEDNFDDNEDFSIHYHKIGGGLSKTEINEIIRLVYDYLDCRYPDEYFRHTFPSLDNAITETLSYELSEKEKLNIINTFAFHEIGYIPDDYLAVLQELSKNYLLAVVIDIWSPKSAWLDLFAEKELTGLFSAASFSSDYGIVKPSPKPFEQLVKQLGIEKNHALMIGDSIRRDLGGATAAGIDCVLVGGATHADAAGCYKNLLEFSTSL